MTPVQRLGAGLAVVTGDRERLGVIRYRVEMPDLADVAERVVDIDDHRWLPGDASPSSSWLFLPSRRDTMPLTGGVGPMRHMFRRSLVPMEVMMAW